MSLGTLINRPRRPKGIKSHRIWYMAPVWQQFAYRSQAHYDLDRVPMVILLGWLADPMNPQHDRAKAVELLYNQLSAATV